MFLSQSPMHWLPGLYIGVLLLLYLINLQPNLSKTSAVKILFLGFCMGFGFFLPSLYWIIFTFMVYFEELFLLIPFALILFPAIPSIFFALGFALSTLFPQGLARSLGIVALLSLSDFLRSYLFTGLPWNNIGYSWGASDALMQSASIFGVYGISVLALLLAALTVYPLAFNFSKSIATLSIASVIVLIGFNAWGNYRMKLLEPVASETLDSGIRIVQPNIAQVSKWDRETLRDSFEKLLTLSQIQRPPWIKTVIWPETATPFILLDTPTALDRIVEAMPRNGTLITGSPRRKDKTGVDIYYNSILALDENENVISHYDKQHLVPFGEYTPSWSILALDLIVGRLGEYSAGDSPQPLFTTLNLPPALASVCYEILFSLELLENIRSFPYSPEWILTLSNDAWFGNSSAPRQLMDMARWRAIEFGIPLVRVNNTGISAVTDAIGGILEVRNVGEVGVIDFRLTKPLDEKTLFTALGIWGFLAPWMAVFTISVILALIPRFSYWKSKRTSL